jgi:hypothetical protein
LRDGTVEYAEGSRYTCLSEEEELQITHSHSEGAWEQMMKSARERDGDGWMEKEEERFRS